VSNFDLSLNIWLIFSMKYEMWGGLKTERVENI
jgi:hypothetical protein